MSSTIIGFLWFFRIAKNFSFYLYLWQLKEYHIGRFKAHFETREGRKLLLNKISLIKALLLFFYAFSFFGFFYFLFVLFLFLIYLFQFFKLILDIHGKKLKLPVFTKKAIFLISVLFFVEIIFFFSIFNLEKIFFYLLLFDILSPLIASIIILLFQPATVFLRNKTLKKAKKKIELFNNLKVIGITGSYGKTSTKEFLGSILSEKFNVLTTPGHINSEIGISKTILSELNSAHNIFICEMGAYNKGGIRLLSNIVKPSIGILTGINQQHLSLFGKMEKLFSAEGGKELFKSLPDDGFMIVNGESKYILNLYGENKDKKKIYFSFSEKENIKKDIYPSIFAKNIIEKEDKLYFEAEINNKEFIKCKVNLLGKQNIENLLLAIFISYKLGMSSVEIKKGLLKIKQEQGGIILLKNEKDFKIIDATYSANLNSVMALIDYLKVFNNLKKTIIMPCLIELGSSSKKIHRKIGNKIGEVCDLGIITTKDYYEDIKEGADINKNNICYLNNPEKIALKIKERRGVVLLKGRLGGEIIEKLKELN